MLELTFEGRLTSSSNDVTHPTSKDSIATEEEEIVLPYTTVVPPSDSKDPEKALKEKKKKVKNTKSVDQTKLFNTPKIPDISSNHPPVSTLPLASKWVAKVTTVDRFADLAYDISTVIGPRDTSEDDDLLTLSNLIRENKICRKRQERKLRR